MNFDNKGRYYVIEGTRYEWRWEGSLCGLYEIEEPEDEDKEAVENSTIPLHRAPLHSKMYLEREEARMKQTKKTKVVDYTPLITRNEKGTVLSVPISALKGFISIYPVIKKEVK